MISIKLKMYDSYTDQHVKLESSPETDAWPDQIEVFFQFLCAQGYVITYASFLEMFGEEIKRYNDCFKEDK